MTDLNKSLKENATLPTKLINIAKREGSGNIPTSINLQKAFYNLKVADLEKRIERLKKRNDEILIQNEEIQNLIDYTDKQTTSEISILTIQVKAETAQIISVKNNIDTIETLRRECSVSHCDRMNQLQIEYINMRIKLLSQFKVLNSKLNSLDQYKILSKSLQKKFETKNELIEKKEQELKNVLHDIEFKFEITKEKIRKEMLNTFLTLSTKFHIEKIKSIPVPIKRLIPENIALKGFLKKIVNNIYKIGIIHANQKIQLKKNYKILKSTKLEEKKNLKKLKDQKDLIKLLEKMIEEKNTKFVEFDLTSSLVIDRFEATTNTAKYKTDDIKYQVQLLKVIIHQEQVKLNITKSLLNQIMCKIKKYLEIIYDLKNELKHVSGIDKETDNSKNNLNALFSDLLRILQNGIATWNTLKIESLESICGESKTFACEHFDFKTKHAHLNELLDEEEKSF